MCSIANLFDRNIRKVNTKNEFFCPECLGASLIFIPNNPFQCDLFLLFGVCVCVCVCVFYSYAPFLSVLFVFHRKNLVLSHLLNRYMTFTGQQCLKRKDIPERKFLTSIEYSFNHIM